MHIESLTPEVQAAPGDLVIGRVRLVNDGDRPATYTLHIVGLDDAADHLPVDGVALAAGEHVDVDVPLAIPAAFAAGRHSIAVRAVSDRPEERPSLTALTVAIESIGRLGVEVKPSTVRGRRRPKFDIDLANREAQTLDLSLVGEGHDVAVRLSPDHVVLPPGRETRVKGRLRGPSHVAGETLQHVFTITARGRSQPLTVTANYFQKPSMPRGLRIFALALSVLTLWAAILGYGVYWYAKHHNKVATPASPAALTVDTNGDGIPDAPASAANGANGSATGGGGAGAGGASGEAASTAPGDQAPTLTVMNGKVKAADTGEDGGVTVTLAPLDLGAPPPGGATVVGGPGNSKGGPLKLWPARYGFHASADTLRQRATLSVETKRTATDGAWLFADVAIRANYELNFAKAGFDSQSFVVTPPADGSPVKLDVKMLPAKGAVSGVVVAADGTPLGGADIVVTDGTLTLSTTSSTAAGAVGTWSLSGVSTPNTYTLTATLRGYGTQVVQLPMDPGQQKGGVRIVMTPGLGSISGRVTAAGAPLGGVIITASNGDLTRTTTTLTNGDAGFFSFPELPVPGDYTVTVNEPGYVTQTRRVAVTGNETSIDFALVKTTATITGVVVSDTKGPLPAASVTIAKDKLTFRTVTAVQPDAGSFTVSDLPPGTYLVEFSRYDHRTASQLVDVAAGETKDLGTIPLVFEQRPTVDQTGRIVVSVTDSTGAPLTGATASVIDIATGNIVATLTDATGTQATFAFDRVPIGTYIVRVSRPIYRTATQRVSVGLGEVRVNFALLKLGQVSGRLVDSLVPARQLTDYEITLFRINDNGTEDRAGTPIVVPPNAAPNADGDILWESPPNSLTTGTYRVEVTRAPPGYAVVNDQVLDNTLPPTSPRMRFQIRPDNEAPVRVNDIQADPFPKLTGHVFVPTLTSATNNQVSFDPIDADMTVTLTCPGGLTANVPAVLSDELGNSPAIDTFTFDPILIQAKNLLGSCVLTVSAAGSATANVALSRPLTVSDGVTSSDQVVNVGLFPPPAPLGGPVFWRDLGISGNQEIPINGALVRTITPVIVGFAAAQGSDPNAPPRPVIAPAPLQTTSSNGLWQLNGQIFGQTTYEFSHSAFTTGTMQVTVDQTRRTITALSSLVVQARGGGQTAVEMAALAGSIQGQVQIATVDPAPRYTAVGLSATPPGGTPLTVPVTATGTFAVDPAIAGTWRLDVTPPTNHVFAPNAPSTLTGRVDPHTVFRGFNPSLIELATVTVRVLDTPGQPIDVNGVRPSVTLVHTHAPINGDPATSNVTQTVDATGTAVFTNVDINRINPTGLSVPYTATVTMPGFDTSTAVTTITGAPDAIGPTFTVNVFAGSKPVATMRLPKYGVIASRVVGQVGPATEPIRVGPPLSIVAKRELDTNFNPVADAPVPVTVDPLDPNGFAFSGPPGYYRIDVSHPFFESPPISVPPSDLIGSIFYTMTNNNRNTLFGAPFVLRILTGTLSLSAVVSLASNTPVPGAVAFLRQNGALVGTTPLGNFGQQTISNLVPGTYQLEIRAQSPGPPVEDLNFPVLATIELPRGATPQARTLTVRAPMPTIGASITGNVVARNLNGDPVPLPDPVTIDRTFDTPKLDANGNLIDNGATEGDLARGPDDAPLPQIVLTHAGTPLASSLPFTFDNLAAPGRHHLSFSSADGYTSPTPNPLDVDVDPIAPTDVGDRAYVARNVSVVVQLRDQTGARINTATVSLGPPGGGTALVPSASNGDYTFSNVVPDLRAYQLNVTDVFHEDLTNDPVTVLPDADGTLTVTRALRVDAGGITGVAQKQDSPGNVSAIVGTGTVQLFKLTGVSDTVGTFVKQTTPGPGGAYQFSVAEPGSYRVLVVLSGYAPRDAIVTGVALGATSTATTIVVPKFAIIAIAVAGNATTEPSLAVVMTQPAPPIASTRTGNVFTFANLDPDLLYAFSVSADTYITQTVPATGTIDPAVGSDNTSNPFTVTLIQRTVTVTVSTSDSSGAEKSATVHLRVPPANVAGQLTRTGDGTSNVYTFVPVPPGAGAVDATAAGYRTTTAAFAAGGPTQDVPVTLLPLVIVSGVVRAGATAVSGATVTATQGTTTKTATTDGSGNYSIGGLDVGTWSITAVKDGTGATAAASTVPVTATSAAAVTQDLTLAPRTIAFTFTVTNGGAAAAGVTVRLGTATGITSAAGTATLNVVETASLGWTVSSGTVITKTGAASIASPAVAVAVVSRPTLTGVVNNGANPQVGANVRLCPDAQATCVASNDVANDITGTNGTFTLRPDAGTWQVRATFGTLAATATGIVVGADGSISANNLVLALA